MKTKLLTIINHYGINNQQRKLQEEVFELQHALIKYQEAEMFNDVSEDKIITLDLLEHDITEEIADVCVLLMQFANYYKLNSADIGKIIWDKVNRQIERINNE